MIIAKSRCYLRISALCTIVATVAALVPHDVWADREDAELCKSQLRDCRAAAAARRFAVDDERFVAGLMRKLKRYNSGPDDKSAIPDLRHCNGLSSWPDIRANLIMYLFSGATLFREKAVIAYSQCASTPESAFLLAQTIRESDFPSLFGVYARALARIMFYESQGKPISTERRRLLLDYLLALKKSKKFINACEKEMLKSGVLKDELLKALEQGWQDGTDTTRGTGEGRRRDDDDMNTEGESLGDRVTGH